MEKQAANSELDTSPQRVRYIITAGSLHHHSGFDTSRKGLRRHTISCRMIFRRAMAIMGSNCFLVFFALRKKKPAIGPKECHLLQEFRRTARTMTLFPPPYLDVCIRCGK
ncbi:hypothetical protein TRIATDRAFT_297535 [Trichoderma atroviride IMI 206040]|uniref:Uncharacterized protein n=1 Tax=Hypocrea atroviridis (strain ATCC 20476 / IMI 206040) TaxID=452589 RepID=G9NIG9_HYPAI|nr:uncharacterized protein TRIATDRAFT_297535 [Trichoderma atroviride IMI 206040]EHK49581.1 hypothetical protein TRIATDRAFT_297535 [Trichoderma atroviride IMI 206040]